MGNALFGRLPPSYYTTVGQRLAAVYHKRRPEMDANGFHGESFTGGFDRFDTMKRRPEMDATGFEGESFTGFGGFETMKRDKDRAGNADAPSKKPPPSAGRYTA